MKKIIPFVALILMFASCSTQKELSYLNNLDAAGGEDYFTMEIPEYQVQPRDILYISAKLRHLKVCSRKYLRMKILQRRLYSE